MAARRLRAHHALVDADVIDKENDARVLSARQSAVQPIKVAQAQRVCMFVRSTQHTSIPTRSSCCSAELRRIIDAALSMRARDDKQGLHQIETCGADVKCSTGISAAEAPSTARMAA